MYHVLQLANIDYHQHTCKKRLSMETQFLYQLALISPLLVDVLGWHVVAQKPINKQVTKTPTTIKTHFFIIPPL